MSKTILQICPRLDSGGIERGTVDVAIATKRAGFNSIVASSGGYLEKELKCAGVEHIRLPLHSKHPFAVYQNSKKLAQLIIDRNIDLVHARSRIPIWCAVLAKKRCQFSLITGCHSLHDAGWFKLKKLYNRGIIYGDKIVATSNCVVHYLQREYAVPSEKIVRIYRGIDDVYFEPRKDVEQIQQSLSLKYGVPLDKKIILMPGRISRWKGQHIFLEAFANLSRDSNAIAIIVGRVKSHQYLNELHSFIKQESLHDRVFFIDECQDMLKLYSVSDVVVSASTKPESFGRVAVESQSLGCITIATDLGGSKETLIADETGFLVKPGCSIALAKALQTSLMLDEQTATKMKQRARQHMQQYFSKTTMLKQVQNLYEQFLV